MTIQSNHDNPIMIILIIMKIRYCIASDISSQALWSTVGEAHILVRRKGCNCRKSCDKRSGFAPSNCLSQLNSWMTNVHEMILDNAHQLAEPPQPDVTHYPLFYQWITDESGFPLLQLSARQQTQKAGINQWKMIENRQELCNLVAKARWDAVNQDVADAATNVPSADVLNVPRPRKVLPPQKAKSYHLWHISEMSEATQFISNAFGYPCQQLAALDLGSSPLAQAAKNPERPTCGYLCITNSSVVSEAESLLASGGSESCGVLTYQ